MVSEIFSTPTGGRVLRSSTKTTTLTRVPIHVDSPAYVSKISSKRKVNKRSNSSSKKNKTKEEGNEYSNKDEHEEFDDK